MPGTQACRQAAHAAPSCAMPASLQFLDDSFLGPGGEPVRQGDCARACAQQCTPVLANDHQQFFFHIALATSIPAIRCLWPACLPK